MKRKPSFRPWLAMTAAALLLGLPYGAARAEVTGGARPSAAPALMVLQSNVLVAGRLPQRYACDGQQVSPPLTWSNPPAGTKSLVLTVEDFDAPNGPFVHWVAYGIPPTTRSLPEGAAASVLLGHEGTNSHRQVGYAAP